MAVDDGIELPTLPTVSLAPMDENGVRNGPRLSADCRSSEPIQDGIAFSCKVPFGVWRVDLAAEGLWIPSAVIEVSDQPPRALEFHAEQGTLVTATIRDEDLPPRDFEIRLSLSPMPEGLVRGSSILRKESVCPGPSKGEAWACPVPVGNLDLRVQVLKFQPSYYWDAVFEPNATFDLGRIRLEKGASLVGWVVEPTESTVPLTDIELKLVPNLGDGSPAHGIRGAEEEKEELRTRLRHVEARPSKKGAFRFTGLEPGEYRLLAEGTDQSIAKYRSEPIRIVEGVESRLQEPVALRAPGSLTLFLTPPVSPDGEPWSVTLLSKYRQANPILGMATESGVFFQENLDPGAYYVKVSSGGRRAQKRWLTLDLQVDGDATEFVDLGIVEVRGTVIGTIEGETSTLWFGHRSGGQALPMEIGEEGAFQGFLPRAGTWNLELETRGGTLRRLEAVEIEKPAPGTPAVVEIELPLTNLFGKVVDESGQAVVRATVLVVHQEGERLVAQMPTDTDGEFEIHSVRPGPIWVVAMGISGESAPVSLDLKSGLNTREVELVTRPQTAHTVRFVSEDGPVVGARVMYKATHEGPTRERRTLSGPDGSVALELPKGTNLVDYQITTGSFGLKVGRLALAGPSAEIPEIPVSRLGGQLDIELEGVEASEILIYKDGVRLISTNTLLHWLRLTTRSVISFGSVEKFSIPAVDWGQYVLCLRSEMKPSRRHTLESQGIPEGCAGGYVPPGGQLRLSLVSSESSF